MSSKPTDTTPTLATSYQEGYIDGVKVALSLVQYATSVKEAEASLTHMVETLNKQETTT